MKKIYDLWIKEFNSSKHYKIFKRIKNFIDNKNFRLDYKSAKFHLKDEINKGRNIN